MKNDNQGKRPDQYESDAKILFLGMMFLLVVIILIILFPKGAESQNKFGFLVTYESYEVRGVEKLELSTFAEVDSVLSTKFEHKLSSKELMEGTGRFVIETGLKCFYCEIKTVNKNGNLMIRHLTKSELKEVEQW